MPDAGPRYWAFLSYSHTDLRWARWLHRALEDYAVPRRLVGRETPDGPAPSRLRPIFRDLDEMGAGPDLSDRLKVALSESASLIVVCSPAAAASPWVSEEIRQFKADHGEGRVFAVIVAGEPFASERPNQAATECFPQALRERAADGTRIEPIAADVRPGREPRRAALLKLVAGVLDLPLDELVQRDARRRHRQLLALTSAFGVLAAAMTGLAVVAVSERDEARAERTQAEGLIEFMIGDLREKLQPAGRLDILDALGARAQAYYARQNAQGMDADALGRHARVLHLLGDIQMQRGDMPGALKLFQEAAGSTGELMKRHPRDPQAIYDQAQSVAYIGEVALQGGDTRTALAELQTYQALARRLVGIDPTNPDWQAEVAEADNDVGVVLLGQGRPNEAAAALQEAFAVSSRLAAAAPGKRQRQWDESQILGWLADAEVARGRLPQALSDRAAEGAIYSRLLAVSPGDNDAAVALATSRANMARIELAGGDAAAAIDTLRGAEADTDRLMREAPENAAYKANAYSILQLLAQALLEKGRFADAAAVAQRSIDLCQTQVRALADRHDSAPAWQGRLGVAEVMALKVGAAGATTLAAQARALAAAADEADRLKALYVSRPQVHALALGAAEAALLAGDVASFEGTPARAKTFWAWSAAVLTKASPAGSATDRTAVLLRQVRYRLSSLHPAGGPLKSDASGQFRSVAPALRTPADYRW